MRTTMALIVKFLMTFIFAWIAFKFTRTNTLGSILTLSIAATIINYLIGDLLLLPSMGNIVASLGDGIMAAAAAYIFDILIRGFTTTAGSLITFAILVAIGEYFFHIYLRRDDKVAP